LRRIHARIPRPSLLSLLALLAVSSPAWALASVPASPPPSWIHDGAGLLSRAELDSLTARKAQLEQQTGARLVVLTLATADGESPKSIAVRTLNAWNAGRKSALLLVLISPRELYIQPGTDLAPVFDSAAASSICSGVVAPLMRGGDRSAALRAGLEAIAARIASASDTASGGTASAPSPRASAQPLHLRRFGESPEASSPESSSWEWMAWVGGLAGLGAAGWGLSRLFAQKCPKCETRMQKSSEIIEQPTTWSTGEGRHTYSCGSCGYSCAETYFITKIVKRTSTTYEDHSSSSWSSSSDSSSSSSSDRSGGGGSSW
jgi:uncharacterized membrane protein YgcG